MRTTNDPPAFRSPHPRTSCVVTSLPGRWWSEMVERSVESMSLQYIRTSCAWVIEEPCRVDTRALFQRMLDIRWSIRTVVPSKPKEFWHHGFRPMWLCVKTSSKKACKGWCPLQRNPFISLLSSLPRISGNLWKMKPLPHSLQRRRSPEWRSQWILAHMTLSPKRRCFFDEWVTL